MRRTFLIAYDLNKGETSAEYQRLIKEIKSYGTWAKPLESTFFVSTESTAKDVRNYLKQFIDSNDELLILDVTEDDWATQGIDAKVTEWMKNNL